jgi:hypothetical protein
VLRGRAVYGALGCARCHGSEGRGDGADAIVEGSDGRLVRARDFRPRDAVDVPRLRLRGGARPQDVLRAIVTGLDAKAMPPLDSLLAEARRGGSRSDGAARLVPPLHDVRLTGGTDREGRAWEGVGVSVREEGGARVEVLEDLLAPRPGGLDDRWALVLYVLHLARTEAEVARDAVAWPAQPGGAEPPR